MMGMGYDTWKRCKAKQLDSLLSWRLLRPVGTKTTRRGFRVVVNGRIKDAKTRSTARQSTGTAAQATSTLLATVRTSICAAGFSAVAENEGTTATRGKHELLLETEAISCIDECRINEA